MIYSYKIFIDNTENTVSLNVATANDRGLLEFSGDKKLKLKTWLKNQTGALGHIIGEATTPMDLDYVMIENCPWDWDLVSGEIFNYNPDVPEKAKT